MNDKQVTFTLSIEKANLVFTALSGMPYSQVAQLIAELQAQAQEQLKQDQPVGE